MKNRNTVRCVKLAFSKAKGHFILMAALGALNCVLGVLSVYLINGIFQQAEQAAVVGAATYTVYVRLALYFAALVASAMYTVYYKRYFVQFRSIPAFEKKIRTKLHEKCGKISNDRFEIPDVDVYLKQARAASVNVYRFTEIVITVFVLLLSALSLGGYIATFNAWYGLFILFAVLPSLCRIACKSRLWKKFYRQMSVLKREEATYSEAICGLNSSMENKLNGADRLLTEKWAQTRKQSDAVENVQSVRMFLLKSVLSVGTVVGEYGGFALSVWLLYNRSIGFGEFSAAIAAYAALKETFKGLFELFGELGQYGMMTEPYFKFIDLPERRSVSEAVYTFNDRITLDNVSFFYPNSDKPAIDKVSLEIKKGEHIAVVGENGAGKTTLVQILLGLYEVGEGTVAYDGKDVRLFAEKDLYRDKSTVRQKFDKYKGLTVIDNILLGRDYNETEAERLKAQLGIDYLKNDTFLGREFGGGELSGGEWQKIACARGFAKPFDFIALDEPTSAVDPLMEKSMYDFFAEYGKEKTMVVVTHRLGSVRLSDRIIVMKNGKIEATGNHETLLKTCAYYKKLWETQAQVYE